MIAHAVDTDLDDLMGFCDPQSRFFRQCVRVMRDVLKIPFAKTPAQADVLLVDGGTVGDGIADRDLTKHRKPVYVFADNPVKAEMPAEFRFFHCASGADTKRWLPYPLDAALNHRKDPGQVICHTLECPQYHIRSTHAAFLAYRQWFPKWRWVGPHRESYDAVLSMLSASTYHLTTRSIHSLDSKSILECLMHKVFVIGCDHREVLYRLYDVPTLPIMNASAEVNPDTGEPFRLHHTPEWVAYIEWVVTHPEVITEAVNRAAGWARARHGFDAVANRLTMYLRADNLI